MSSTFLWLYTPPVLKSRLGSPGKENFPRHLRALRGIPKDHGARRLVSEVHAAARILEQLPHLLLGEAVVRHTVGVGLFVRSMRLEVQDEEHAAGVETLGQTLRRESGIVEVVEAGPHAREVEAREGGVSKG